MARRTWIAVSALALIVSVAILTRSPNESPPLSATRPSTAEVPGQGSEDEGQERGGAEELAEQEERTGLREDALRAALAAGTFGTATPAGAAPAPGWDGERVVDPAADDWEPAVAADSRDPFVYVLTTRYGAGKPCKGNCPTPWIALTISRDGGDTWSADRPLCACKGSGQFDPIIEVAANTGDVYAAFMNGYNVVVVRSRDHGRTWSEPVPTYGKVSWNDKPVLTVGPSGRDVYVSWNGPLGGDPWIAQSHDGGRTWTQRRLVRSDLYFFAFDASVLPDGTIAFAESAIDYTGGSDSVGGRIEHHLFISRNHGRTWIDRRLATVEPGVPCQDCRADYYVGHTTVSADAAGRVVFAYDGAITPYGPQRIWVRTSTDGARTWSVPRLVSDPGEHATAPVVEGAAPRDLRLVYQQTANGGDLDRWNTWYRRSTDGGLTWSVAVRISDAPGGADYKHPDGYDEIYGDYLEMTVTSTGETFAAWGEAFSYIGPGGVWFNRGR